ncbi:hypothetical protein QCD60_22210 [Pokkaliibacter sp. MBI-7]|uniref:hypothetical protein n=1 Tax=Pokkaliibacter sp. MBI-7 TaxID=3040600 RepID=UPI00244C9A7A|nr:hypothetical protein [Pokkaliibacter sp. MBI-7]MDH2435243.1 hypothetical protein [Pokkaliibacter sp. MBI-7]
MKKWESEIFKDNNIKLMNFHIVFSCLYPSFLGLFGIAWYQHSGDVSLLASALCLFFTCLHAALAYGSKHKIEASRKLSELLGVMLMFGFPVGTIIGYFFRVCQTNCVTAPFQSAASGTRSSPNIT